MENNQPCVQHVRRLPNISELKMTNFVANRLVKKAKKSLKRISSQISVRNEETTPKKVNRSPVCFKRMYIKSDDSKDMKIITLPIMRPKATVQDIISKVVDEPKKQLTQIHKRDTMKFTKMSIHPQNSSEFRRVPKLHIPSESISFPKAIIYPDKKRIEEQQIKTKPTDHEPLSFIKVFTMSTKIKPKVSSTPAKAPEKSEVPITDPKKSELYEAVIGSEDDLEEEIAAFRYVIPQNLLLSDNDKLKICSASSSSSPPHTSNKDENNSSTKISGTKLYEKLRNMKDEVKIGEDELPFQMATRPKENNELIDMLGEYRAISKYLFKKLNLEPPNDFDACDDYINYYKMCRN